MNATSKLNQQLSTNLLQRLGKIKPQDNSTVVCEVTRYNIDTGTFEGKAPDGSLRYFRFIGNASLPIGSQVSVILPEQGTIGWADTKAR
jgi:hypothetical protein